MKIEVKLEELVNQAKSAKVTQVYKKIGDSVQAEEALFDLEDGKNTVTITATGSGKIVEIEAEPGQEVKVGQVLALIEGEQIGSKADDFDYFSNMLQPAQKELDCDIVIVGGGPGGYVASIEGALMGAKVILVEKDALGGTCLNRGCIPTKALVRSAGVYRHLKEAAKYGCIAENIAVDLAHVMARKDEIVQKLVAGIEYLMKKRKVEVIHGVGEVIDSQTVQVKNEMEETTIKAKNMIIATGSKVSLPPIPGVNLEGVLTSDQILQLDVLPQRLIIVGGGVIGMEFAFIFNSFGVEVTVVEYLPDCLASLDKDLIREISRGAQKSGIKILTGSAVEEIVTTEDGSYLVSVTQKEKKKYLLADKVLMAAGRKPCLEGTNWEKLGINLNENGVGIKVNEKMETNLPRVYAIGDVTNKILLAHVASHQGMVAVKNILGKNNAMDYDAIPSVIFTDPEIAVVGISEKMAKEAALDVIVSKFPFAANGKALALGEESGFVKLIQDKASGKVVGGAIIGAHATELIAELTLAIKNQLTAEQIVETVHAHPTTAEVIHEAALGLEGGSIHFAK